MRLYLPRSRADEDVETTTEAGPTEGGSETVLLVTNVASMPEASTWAKMLVGFAGLGYARYRGAKDGARNKRGGPKTASPAAP